VLFLPGPQVSLVDAHLSRADLADTLLIRGHFAGANLRAEKLVGADLGPAVLSRSVAA